jgi:hypothetical protein
MSAMGGISAHSLHWALLVGVAVQGFGLNRLVHWTRRVRIFVLAEEELGIEVPVPVERHPWDLAGTDRPGDAPIRPDGR